MSNINEPAFRHRRIRWLDEEVDSGYRYSSTRDQLNDELFANEQSHFEAYHGQLFEVPSTPASTQSWFSPLFPSTWNSAPFDPPPDYVEQPPRSDLTSVDGNLTPFQPPQGYMAQPSAFGLDVPLSLTESTFLDSYPTGKATLTYQNDDGELESIRNVNLELIDRRCPLLGMAFEPGRSGPRLYLETLTPRTAYPFLRYLYTGSYALRSTTGEPGDYYEDVPTSVLFHCQLYRLADIYDLIDLKSQAYVNILRQCEFGCSSPDKPIDLCAAIRFIYDHLPNHENLIDAIVNYCVSCFLQHRLDDDEDFKKLAYDLRPFHQALCSNSRDRGFENETASAIVQMPFKPYIPETYASREDVAATKLDDVFHFHATDQYDTTSKKRRVSEKVEEKSGGSITLPLRARPVQGSYEEWTLPVNDAPYKDEDYKLGSKRRASSIAKEPRSTPSSISQQLQAAECNTAPVEAGYEILERPEAAVMSEDSDSDTSDFVEIQRETSPVMQTLPIRTFVPSAGSSAKSIAGASESDSDSEWTMV